MRNLNVPPEILKAIGQQARNEMPNEACGYLAGEIGDDGSRKAVKILPLTNTDASPEHFTMDPEEQFTAMKTARNDGLSLVAVYHSHPESPARMSLEDIRLANDTEMVHVIYSVPDDELKGFTVNRDKVVSPYPTVIKK